MTHLIRRLQRVPVGLWAYWGFLVGLLVLFALLAEEVVERDSIAFDLTILEMLDRWRTPGLAMAAEVLNVVGGSYFLAPVTAIGAILLWRRRSKSAVFVGLAVFGAMALSGLAKLIFERARPQDFEALVHSEGFSFPSGHTMGSTAVALAVYFVVRAHAPKWQWLAFAIGAAFALAVGVSRSYLLVHYPSDVVAGWLLATAWVLGVQALYPPGKPGQRGSTRVPSPSEASDATPDRGDTEPNDPREASSKPSAHTRSGVVATALGSRLP